MNKITLVFVFLILVGILLAQEPVNQDTTAIGAMPDTLVTPPVPEEAIVMEAVSADTALSDTVPAAPLIPETESAQPVPTAVVSEEQVPPPQIPSEAITQPPVPAEFVPEEPIPAQPVRRPPAPRPPVQEGLIPPEEVLPALVSPGTTPMKPSELTNYGQMIYWKSLTPAEKKVFLYAYLYRTYETLQQVKTERDLKSAVRPFQKKIADPVFDIYRPVDEAQNDDLIFWIDKFYRIDLNKDKSFGDALRYASEKMKTGSKSLQELFQENY